MFLNVFLIVNESHHISGVDVDVPVFLVNFTHTRIRFQMIGLIKPTAGTAFVEGLDIRTEMDGIYASMGVCPQHE